MWFLIFSIEKNNDILLDGEIFLLALSCNTKTDLVEIYNTRKQKYLHKNLRICG